MTGLRDVPDTSDVRYKWLNTSAKVLRRMYVLVGNMPTRDIGAYGGSRREVWRGPALFRATLRSQVSVPGCHLRPDPWVHLKRCSDRSVSLASGDKINPHICPRSATSWHWMKPPGNFDIQRFDSLTGFT